MAAQEKEIQELKRQLELKETIIKSKDDVIANLKQQLQKRDSEVGHQQAGLDQLTKQVEQHKAIQSQQVLLNNDLSLIREKLSNYEMQKSQLEEKNEALEKQIHKLTVEGIKPRNLHEADVLNCIGYRKQIDS